MFCVKEMNNISDVDSLDYRKTFDNSFTSDHLVSKPTKLMLVICYLLDLGI